MNRDSKFIESLLISKRGQVKIAASQVPGREATSKIDVKKVLKTFEKSPDVSKKTMDQYKQRAELDTNSKQVAQDFFKDLSDARKNKKQMHLMTAMSLRQAGIFKVAGRDVYEDLETGDFWKMSEDKKHVVRMFKEDEKGIADKRASIEENSIPNFDEKEAAKLNTYSVMGSTPGDGGVVQAESFDDAAATYFSQESGDYTKQEILEEIKKRPGKKISETEYEYGDYEIKLVSDKQADADDDDVIWKYLTDNAKSVQSLRGISLDDIVSSTNYVAEDVVDSLETIYKRIKEISGKKISASSLKHFEKKAETDSEQVERFEEIMDEIQSLVEEAFTIVRQSGNRTLVARAESYWYPTIARSVRGNATMFDMNSTLESLKEESEISEEEDK
jgi:membrane-associated HD superfamily phosphohydrolase